MYKLFSTVVIEFRIGGTFVLSSSFGMISWYRGSTDNNIPCVHYSVGIIVWGFFLYLFSVYVYTYIAIEYKLNDIPPFSSVLSEKLHSSNFTSLFLRHFSGSIWTIRRMKLFVFQASNVQRPRIIPTEICLVNFKTVAAVHIRRHQITWYFVEMQLKVWNINNGSILSSEEYKLHEGQYLFRLSPLFVYWL